MDDSVSIVPAELPQVVEVVTDGRDYSGATCDDDLVRLWLAGKAETTNRAYSGDVRRLFGHLASMGKTLRTATLADVQGYINSIEGAPRTKARRVASLKSLLAFAYRTGYSPFDVGRVIKTPKLENDLAERILPEEQVIRMIATARSGRDRVLVRTLYVGGLRVSEAELLRWKHVHEHGDGCVLTVFGKGAKTRHVPVTATLTSELAQLRAGHGPEDPVFRSRTGRPLGKRDMQRVVRKVARAAGIDLAVSPHWMRHAHVSHALDRGAPIHLVASTVGHESLSTTTRYAHARPGDGSARYLPA